MTYAEILHTIAAPTLAECTEVLEIWNPMDPRERHHCLAATQTPTGEITAHVIHQRRRLNTRASSAFGCEFRSHALPASFQPRLNKPAIGPLDIRDLTFFA